jgi:hypothetical protein
MTDVDSTYNMIEESGEKLYGGALRGYACTKCQDKRKKVYDFFIRFL